MNYCIARHSIKHRQRSTIAGFSSLARMTAVSKLSLGNAMSAVRKSI